MEKLLDLINKYPYLPLILLGITIFLLFIIVLQGRSIKTPWFRIGRKDKKEPKPVAPVAEISQNPVITQAPTINVFSGQFTDEQMEKISNLIDQKLCEIKELLPEKEVVLFKPPEIPPRSIYIYSTLNMIGRKLFKIVYNWGGGWAGISLASFDDYLKLAERHRLIPQDLAEEINVYVFYTRPLLNSDAISDKSFSDIQYFAASINRNLDMAVERIENDPRSMIYQEKHRQGGGA